ncbi:hypothetical protein [Enterococcus casseliflavus]|uniref:hypothetical protein n=1 Tax=Enterococcus casseliflavus TaxID=37734 RepID=UPI0035CC579F
MEQAHKIDLPELYEIVKTYSLKELREAMENTTDKNEQSFYKDLYTSKLAANQMKIINQKEFII